MAGRTSFKSSSYFASSAQGLPAYSPRPSFTRSSSATSVVSTHSDDSILTQTLQNLEKEKGKMKGIKTAQRARRPPANKNNVAGKDHSPSAAIRSAASASGITGTPSCTTFVRPFPDSPGRNQSRPIAIQLPGRDRSAVYTPLSARGDLPGGYFPNHEDITRSYSSHPFSDQHQYHEKKSASSVTHSPGMMSNASSPTTSNASETTPRSPHLLVSPLVPEPTMHSMGKYYPSNYKSPPSTSVSSPMSNSAMLSSTNLALPLSRKRNTSGRPGHERKSSDVKRKLQQYQRDMIAQASLTAGSGCVAINDVSKEPISPRLLPAGSPGPITPFELEESSGYLIAGTRSGSSHIGQRMNRESEMEIVGCLISTEKGGRQSPGQKPAVKV